MSENTPIQFISQKMESLQVPDNQPSCQYIKDGKLNFFETKLRGECHPVIAAKLIEYRVYRTALEAIAHTNQQVYDIPPAFMGLIAALVQDSGDSLPALTNRINEVLSPFMRNENIANKFDTAIEKAIRKIATKVNYGLSEEVYTSIERATVKTPWHLYISRWEVKDLKVLPPDMQQIISIRRVDRENMANEFSTFIQQLPATKRSSIVNTKHRKSPTASKEAEENTKSKQTLEADLLEKEERRKKKEEEKRKREEEKRTHDEEKRAIEEEKKKQKEEEKRLREEEKKKRDDERKKKEQSQLRLTSLFAKSTAVESTPTIEKIIEPVISTLFPPFYIKDNVTVTNQNQFLSQSSSHYDSFKKILVAPNSHISIDNFLSELSNTGKKKRGLSTQVDIRTLLLPGSADILNVPNVRQALRMKLLQFSENCRPAYYGTWTKKSHIVHGRNPFAQDLDKLDYDVDSEAEWEPEGEGEDIISGDEDDDDPNADMIDPEDAGWLVPEGYLSENEGIDDDDNDRSHLPIQNISKRIAVRKIVVGPFFHGENDQLKPFETQLFIDISEEGFNPFYKEPSTKATTVAANSNCTTNNNNNIPTSTTTTTNTTSKAAEFTDQHRNALINVINGKSGDSIPSLITEAKSNFILKDVSKRQLEANIKNIAVKEKRGSDTKPTWYIKEPSQFT